MAHSLVVMLAVVLIKRELHNLDGRLSLGYAIGEKMEPLAGFAAPRRAIPGLNQYQFAVPTLACLGLPHR